MGHSSSKMNVSHSPPSPPPANPSVERRKPKGSRSRQSTSRSQSAGPLRRGDSTVQRVMKQDELCELLESMGFPAPVIQECLSRMEISTGRRTVIDANALIEQLLRSSQFHDSEPQDDIPDVVSSMRNLSVSPQSPPKQTTAIPVDTTEGFNPHNFSVYDSSSCKICFERPIDTAILRCGHLALCSRCSRAGLKRCPICRKEISEIVRIYHV